VSPGRPRRWPVGSSGSCNPRRTRFATVLAPADETTVRARVAAPSAAVASSEKRRLGVRIRNPVMCRVSFSRAERPRPPRARCRFRACCRPPQDRISVNKRRGPEKNGRQPGEAMVLLRSLRSGSFANRAGHGRRQTALRHAKSVPATDARAHPPLSSVNARHHPSTHAERDPIESPGICASGSRPSSSRQTTRSSACPSTAGSGPGTRPRSGSTATTPGRSSAARSAS